MIYQTTRLSAEPANPSAPAITRKATSVSSQSFARQLVSAESASAPSKTRTLVTSQPTSAVQKNVASQKAVASSSLLGFNGLVAGAGPPILPAATTPNVSSVPEQWYASDSVDDAYWAKQPEAVQALRGISDYDRRMELGEQLASEGYSIDVPIMMWGWDAGKVMAMRQANGYTWVPSALQQPVTAAPGAGGGGIIPYDPYHPPAGSILVG